ncbi:MAG: CoA transferase, partial [Gammaproteobacteria bacterium]
ADLLDDAHLGAVGFFRALAHPSEGALEVPDPGVRFDRAPLPVRHAQPTLGADGVAVLREAGLDDAAIAAALDADDPQPNMS